MPVASAQVRDRLASGMRQVDGLPVLIVSGVAALVMTGGELVLRRHHEDETDEHDLSVTAVLLDTIADAAAAGVAAKGAIILPTDGWYWLDPAVALTIAFIVALHAIALIRKVLIRLGPAVADGSGEPSGTSAQRRRVARNDATGWADPSACLPHRGRGTQMLAISELHTRTCCMTRRRGG